MSDQNKDEQPMVLQSAGPLPLLAPTPRRTFLLTAVMLILSVTALIVAVILYVRFSIEKKEAANNTVSARVVTLTGDGYSPRTIKIKKGQTVIWVNATTEQRSFGQRTAATLNNFGTPMPLSQGSTYIYTFSEAGAFRYNDPSSGYAADGIVVVVDKL